MAIDVTTGKEGLHYEALFPLPVSASRAKTRVARKSAYVEIIAAIVGPLDKDQFPSNIFPLSADLQVGSSLLLPVNTNMPYINLSNLPTLDTNRPSKLEWLITHVTMMFSARERKIREANMASTDPASDVRVDFKDGLFSLFMHSSGLQGGTARIFALHKSGKGGVHVLIFVSSLKLDLTSHTVVLDTAVLPLTEKVILDPAVQRCVQELQYKKQFRTLNVTDEELRIWKMVLPAFAERCRTWTHRSQKCEYRKLARIPAPAGLEDGASPLCSCGMGQIPPNFMRDVNLTSLNVMLSQYATRVTIPPCFAVPYVEEAFRLNPASLPPLPSRKVPASLPLPSSATPSESEREICGTCGSDRLKASAGGGGGPAALMRCGRCRRARYCSQECQKADWREHKKICGRM